MGLIRQSATAQIPTNTSGLVTASNAREVFGVVEDCLTDAILDINTLINNIQIGANGVGNIQEVQLKGAGNTLLSTSNFKYDITNSILEVIDNSKFILPMTGTKNFVITQDTLLADNLLEINSDKSINIGSAGSNITLKRGASVSDEALTFTNDLLNLQNSNFSVTSASSSVGNALTVINLSNLEFFSVSNIGRTRTRELNATQVSTISQNFTSTGTNPVLAINLDNGSYCTVDLTGAAGTLTLTFLNAKVGASYIIRILQATARVEVNINNIGRLDGISGNIITGVDDQDYLINVLYTGTGFIINTGILT